MTTFKKLTCILSALCLVLSMTACGAKPVAITQISLPENFELTVGDAVDPTEEATYWADTEGLTDAELSEAVAGLALTWTTDDEAVAFIDANGALCAADEGETVLTVTSEDGALTASAAVTVHPADSEPVEDDSEPESAAGEAESESEPEAAQEDADSGEEATDSEPVESDSTAAESSPVSTGKPDTAPEDPSSFEAASSAPVSQAPVEVPTCPTCGSKDHTTHPVCGVCGSTDHTSHPTCGVCGSTAHTVHPACPTCGSADHTVHPTCGVCGSTDHTSHPTCPTCGSTEHTTHPAAPAASCPTCGATDHTVHPEHDKNYIIDVEVGTGFEAEGNGGNAKFEE